MFLMAPSFVINNANGKLCKFKWLCHEHSNRNIIIQNKIDITIQLILF